MEELDLSLSILNDILDNDVTFADALRKVFKSDVSKRPLRSAVAALVGCELRHHILFAYILGNNESLSEEDKRLTALILSNIAFVKKLDNDVTKAILKEKLGENYASVEGIVADAEAGKSFIPESLPRTSNHYLSLRYNTPEWVLKIWQHYGFGVTYKILRKNVTPSFAFLRVRDPLTVEELVARGPDFTETCVNGVVSYKGKVAVRKLPEFQKGLLFEEKPAIKFIVDHFKVEEPKELMVYEGDKDNSLLLELIETYKTSIGMNFCVPNIDDYLPIAKEIRKKELRNVNLFAAAPDSLEAGISRPQDLVFASPKSTDFDRIREEPDYLLHFHKQDGESQLYAQEKEVLEGASRYVAENGTLVYLVRTISRKEGHNLINGFLANHPEFHLIEEKQLFPFEPTESSLFYAAMMKQNNSVTTGVPLAPLLTEPTAATANVSAKNPE